MDHATLIVARIEYARQERGISIAELGRRAQIDGKRLWYILNEERALRADEFVRLSIVMGLGLQYFVTPDLLKMLRERQNSSARNFGEAMRNSAIQGTDTRANSIGGNQRL